MSASLVGSEMCIRDSPSTLAWHRPRNRANAFGVWRVLGCGKGMFGHFSPKPTKLMGTVKWLGELKRPLDRSKFAKQVTYKAYKNSEGKVVFSGGKRLKESQRFSPVVSRSRSRTLASGPVNVQPPG
eukprot:4513186-Alexandrium_andersonii.AAC.1